MYGRSICPLLHQLVSLLSCKSSLFWILVCDICVVNVFPCRTACFLIASLEEWSLFGEIELISFFSPWFIVVSYP